MSPDLFHSFPPDSDFSGLTAAPRTHEKKKISAYFLKHKHNNQSIYEMVIEFIRSSSSDGGWGMETKRNKSTPLAHIRTMGFNET